MYQFQQLLDSQYVERFANNVFVHMTVVQDGSELSHLLGNQGVHRVKPSLCEIWYFPGQKISCPVRRYLLH